MQQLIEDIVKEAREALKDRLLAAYTFGSDFGRGARARAGRLLLLVKRVDALTLDELHPTVERAQEHNVHVRIDTAEDILCSADVFPAFALELRDTRALIFGDDLLKNLEISTTDLRLHIEHGLRTLRNDLVRSYVSGGAPDRAELRKRARRLIFLLEGALIASGRPLDAPPSPDAVLTAARQIADDIPEPAWQTLQRFAKNEFDLSGNGARELCASLIEALPPVIEAVDKMQPQS